MFPFRKSVWKELLWEYRLREELDKSLLFELFVLKLVEHLAHSGQLGMVPLQTKIYHRKTFLSSSGAGRVQADIALELYRTTGSEPIQIFVWECKHYTRKVGKSDVQKLYSDLIELGASRAKGFLVTTVGYSRWAYAFAKKVGIGLWRIDMPNNWENLLSSKITYESHLDSWSPPALAVASIFVVASRWPSFTGVLFALVLLFLAIFFVVIPEIKAPHPPPPPSGEGDLTCFFVFPLILLFLFLFGYAIDRCKPHYKKRRARQITVPVNVAAQHLAQIGEEVRKDFWTYLDEMRRGE